MKRILTLGAMLVAVACAQPATLSPAPVSASGNVPLVQVQNDSYAEATIFLDGTRIGVAQGSAVTLLRVPTARIPADGQVRFTARLMALDETVPLPVVEYQEGRKMRISIKPTLSASTAY